MLPWHLFAASLFAHFRLYRVWKPLLVHHKSSTASPTNAMTLFLAAQLVDLLHRLVPRCEERDKLSVGGIPSYLHQLPALLHIPVQEQIEAVPVGVVPGFALVGAAGEK